MQEDKEKIWELLQTADEANIRLAFELLEGQEIDFSEELEALSNELLLAMHDLRTVLLAKKLKQP